MTKLHIREPNPDDRFKNGFTMCGRDDGDNPSGTTRNWDLVDYQTGRITRAVRETIDLGLYRYEFQREQYCKRCHRRLWALCLHQPEIIDPHVVRQHLAYRQELKEQRESRKAAAFT